MKNHLVTRGGGRFRTALCGQRTCPVPNEAQQAAGLEGASNNPDYCDCVACLEKHAEACRAAVEAAQTDGAWARASSDLNRAEHELAALRSEFA